jgi:signal transduction histidine kinase/ActR/RegA family two-component response regulator
VSIVESELAQEIVKLRPGDHLCLFYEKDPREQMPALVPFIQDGLSRDEQFVYIADDQTVGDLEVQLQQNGINVGQECERGALKLWTRREWRQPGELSSERKSRQVLQYIHEASQAGFKGCRFAVEMTWALGPDIGADELEHWEAMINTIFVPGFSGRIACQYNRSRLSPETILAALHTHPLAILGDHVYPNWFYEAPLILDGNAKSSTARVEWMFSVLQRARSAQKERDELIEKRADLAEAERTKDALAKSNEELEQRVKERTLELELANRALRNEMEEQKKLEKQLWQSQKMESIGTLAGGIAHEFNNILNIIKGYTLLIRQSPSVNENVTEKVNVIEETVERGAHGVRQLLTLARRTESCLVLSNPNDLVSELSKLLKQTFPKTIDVTLELDAKLPSLWVDPNQINQALLNLSVNARDAMAGGGKLTLKTLLAEGSKVQDPAATAGPYACIEVKDTGSGMDEAVRNRIFEPFFTTKRVGKGSGLGLAIVYGIVKNHNGFVDVDSEVGRGTSFRLYFPMARSEEKPAVDETPKKEESPPRRANSSATVLVVEDEEKLVYLLRKALLRNQYHVLVASDGAQAIDLYHRRKQDIGVVLLDIGLPKIAGLDVILRMKEENPNVKVIVASGYIDPGFKSKMQRAGVQGFIEKPYNPDDVVRVLCASLESLPRQLDASASDETPRL